jgi:1,4-dihydroxy-2-naphthoyl-CoA hydrolase
VHDASVDIIGKNSYLWRKGRMAVRFYVTHFSSTMTTLRPDVTIEFLRERQKGRLPEVLGIDVTSIDQGTLTGELTIRPDLLAPNGFLHAATVVGLADTCCGYACIAHLPEKAVNFTTLELKSNHVSTAREGKIFAKATAVHLGRSTQVWDATVTNGDGKVIALFRCTQMVLY